MIWLDAYERRARLAPGLLALVPIALTVVGLGLKRFPAISIVAGIFSAAGGPVLLAGVVRHMGLRVQDRLWARWSGPPTTRFLRLRTPGENALLRDRHRQAIESLTHERLLDLAAEHADPHRADQVIATAVSRLIALTKGRTFALLNSENAQYGFDRNLYALRWLGRIISSVCLAALLAVGAWNQSTHLHGVSVASAYAAAVVVAGLLLVWIFVPSEGRVRTASDKYARELLQTALAMASDPSAGAASPGAR